jgi:hypothetical protein
LAGSNAIGFYDEKTNEPYTPDNDDYREENRTYGFFFHAYGIKYLFVKIETVS